MDVYQNTGNRIHQAATMCVAVLMLSFLVVPFYGHQHNRLPSVELAHHLRLCHPLGETNDAYHFHVSTWEATASSHDETMSVLSQLGTLAEIFSSSHGTMGRAVVRGHRPASVGPLAASFGRTLCILQCVFRL